MKLIEEIPNKPQITHSDNWCRFIYNNISVGQYNQHPSNVNIKDTIISVPIKSDTILVIQINDGKGI